MEQTHKIKIHFIDGTSLVIDCKHDCRTISQDMSIKRVIYLSKSNVGINTRSVSYIEEIENEMSEM